MRHKVECCLAGEKLLEIRIHVVENLVCLCPIVPQINSHKFKVGIDRIISLINRNSSRITVCHFYYDFYPVSIEFTIDSSCFEKIKLSKPYKEIVYKAIFKKFAKKPKKEKSQISYMSRAYYGKCKR